MFPGLKLVYNTTFKSHLSMKLKELSWYIMVTSPTWLKLGKRKERNAWREQSNITAW
jgi:hypothetical protein